MFHKYGTCFVDYCFARLLYILCCVLYYEFGLFAKKDQEMLQTVLGCQFPTFYSIHALFIYVDSAADPPKSFH